MLKDNGHIDKMFSDGLKNLSVQPRPELWGNINASMKLARRKKRAAVIFISFAAAASFALLFTLSNNSLFQNVDEFQVSGLISKLDTSLSQPTEILKVENLVIEEAKNANVVPKRNVKTRSIQENDTFVIGPKNVLTRRISLQMVLPKSKIELLENMPLSMHLLKEESDNYEKPLSIITQDSLIIVRNIRLLDQFDNSERKKKEWSILGQVSTAYSSYKGDKSGHNSEDGLISIGGGVKVNWQAGKKLAIQTGVIYNKFGQQLAGRSSVLESAAFRSDVVFKEGEAYSSSLETSAGHIKMKGTSKLYDSNEFLSARVSSSSSSDMVQSFEVIEIPFVLRYSLIDKKFGLHMSGGVSTNFMIGNRVYDKSSKQTLGETSGIRSTNFSTSFSLGMEYQLNSKFSLSLEPALKYYLNSINKDSDFNYKPYSIGLSSGIRYKF
jgi:hypothetical protein